jgi:tetratricopeptide (TPR) repeat protein
LATLFTFPNQAQDLAQARTTNQAALKLAREIHDEAAEARALWNMQQYEYFNGRASQAVAYSKQALAITDRLNLRELRAYILNDVSRALVTAEAVPSALKALAEAREIFRAANNLPMLVDNLSTTAETAQVGGELHLSEDFARQAQELSRTIGNVWNLAYSTSTLLTLYALRGEYTQALEACAQTIGFAEQSGFFIARYIAETQLALMYGDLGQPARGIQVLQGMQVPTDFMMMEAWRAGTLLGLYLLNHDLPSARVRRSSARNR